MDPRTDEPSLVAALLCGDPPLSRNRNFELLSTDVGRRARRRAAFLRSIARDIHLARTVQGVVTLDRGSYARGEVRLRIQAPFFERRAYVTLEEVALLARTSPLVARVLDVNAQA